MESPQSIARPGRDEYGAYYETYVGKVPGDDALSVLRAQLAEIEALPARFPGEREQHCYAPGKWSVRELVGHMIDTERVFRFRALWIARGAEDAQPGMEQDDWARTSRAGELALDVLGEHMRLEREASLALLRELDAEALARRGVASEQPLSVRAAFWILAGHWIHHARVLDERYAPVS